MDDLTAASDILVTRVCMKNHDGLDHVVGVRKNLRQLNYIAYEYGNTQQLEARGMRRRSCILLQGPEGTGRMYTAFALAHDCGLDLCLVHVQEVFVDDEDRTLANLRSVFSSIGEDRALYLFDDVDGIVHRHRTSALLTNLIKRNAIMGRSLLVFTSLPGVFSQDTHLCQALDMVLTFGLPEGDQLSDLFRIYLPEHEEMAHSSRIASTCEEMTHSEIARVLNQIRIEALAGGSEITTGQVLNTLLDNLHSIRFHE